MGRICGGVGPNKTNKDAFSIQRVLGVELTPSILKLADLGRQDGAALAVGPVEAPLVRLRIVETKGQAFDMAGRKAIGFELLQLSPAIPDLAGYRSTVKFDPVGRARQWM